MHSHHLTYTFAPDWVPAMRATQGRPPKGTLGPQGQVWRVRWQVQEATEAITTQAQREWQFVLTTNVLDV